MWIAETSQTLVQTKITWLIEVDSQGLCDHLCNGQIYVTVASIDSDFRVHQYAAKIHCNTSSIENWIIEIVIAKLVGNIMAGYVLRYNECQDL